MPTISRRWYSKGAGGIARRQIPAHRDIIGSPVLVRGILLYFPYIRQSMEMKERYRKQNETRRKQREDAAVAKMREWCDEMDVDPDAAEAAYREASEAGLLRGRYEKGLQTAAIYVGSRRSGGCVTIRSVADVTGERLVNVRRMVTVMCNTFGLPPQDIKQHVEAGAKKLGLEIDEAKLRLDEVDKSLGVPMRAGIALRVMSCAIGDPRSVEQIAKAVGLNPKSMRNYVTREGDLKPRGVDQ